ncbi:MAG: putative glycosyltransferase [Anaerocolumna sp.]|jgi:lipopolysaccharide biosynthesis protein|nr:putative glycosyltransferase [Anaerocolumna sp.]
MKILALHLPAFHQVPENDVWWGEGFTEWDNVKKGKPLFKGHIQPVEPLNGYYDLSEKHAIRDQAFYASSKGIDGFVFYHYWFNGHQIFEKPLINFLNDEKPENFSYCFSWANETWARTWDGKDTDVLIKQEYGKKEDWLKHIKYLSKFFGDKHYIKENGKPVLFLYSSNHVECLKEMLDCWNDYLRSVGIKEIYLIETMRPHNSTPTSNADAVFEFEPMYSIRYDVSFPELVKRYICTKLKMIDFQSYNRIWNKIINRKNTYNNLPILRSCFVSWDNSPRKGKYNSIILKDSSPKQFGKYLKRLLASQRKDASNDYIIINAWNEWGEGANLEPSKQYGEEYLNELINAKKCYDDRRKETV